MSVEGYLPDLTIYIYNQQTDKNIPYQYSEALLMDDWNSY